MKEIVGKKQEPQPSLKLFKWEFSKRIRRLSADFVNGTTFKVTSFTLKCAVKIMYV